MMRTSKIQNNKSNTNEQEENMNIKNSIKKIGKYIGLGVVGVIKLATKYNQEKKTNDTNK